MSVLQTLYFWYPGLRKQKEFHKSIASYWKRVSTHESSPYLLTESKVCQAYVPLWVGEQQTKVFVMLFKKVITDGPSSRADTCGHPEYRTGLIHKYSLAQWRGDWEPTCPSSKTFSGFRSLYTISSCKGRHNKNTSVTVYTYYKCTYNRQCRCCIRSHSHLMYIAER